MINARKLLTALGEMRKAARHFETSIPFAILRAIKFQNRALFSLDEVMFWGLTDPAIEDADIRQYVSKEMRVRIEHRLNDPTYAQLTDDKAVFYRHCEQHHLPIPKMLGVFEKDATGSRNREAEETKWIQRLAAMQDSEIVCKPAHGMKGEGVFIAKVRAGDGTVEASGRIYAFPEFFSLLYDMSSSDSIVLQERLEADPSLVALSNSRAIQSLRLVTFLDDTGQPWVVFCKLKIVVGDNDTDNFEAGKSGNLIADIDLESGRIMAVRGKADAEVGLRKFAFHPETGNEFAAFEVPQFLDAMDLARRAALSLPRLRVLGWDIAPTPAGPVIMEANQEWEPFSTAPVDFPLTAPELARLIRPL